MLELQWHGYYSTQAWGILNKCWLGYKIAKSQDDIKRMEYHAVGIRKAQKELGLQVEIFPNLNMWETDNDRTNQMTGQVESNDTGWIMDYVRVLSYRSKPRLWN